MDLDAAALAAAAAPHVTAAITAYGSQVLTKVEDSAATSTVKLGGRLLRRVLGRPDSAPAIEQAVEEVIEAPDEPDRVAALRNELRRALKSDPALAAEVATMLSSAGVVTLIASGEGSVAVQTNSGIIQTGSNSAAWQGPGRP
jgi:hypothetical protein